MHEYITMNPKTTYSYNALIKSYFKISHDEYIACNKKTNRNGDYSENDSRQY